MAWNSQIAMSALSALSAHQLEHIREKHGHENAKTGSSWRL